MVDDGLDKQVRSSLKLLMWAVSNNIPRIALNDVLFDSYHRDIGAPTVPNRHDLQAEYLPELDLLATADTVEELKEVLSVSLSADGYYDRVRRDWINVIIYWIKPVQSGVPGAAEKWIIRIAKPNLIYLPSSATADNIETLITNSIDEFVLLLY